MNFNTRSKYSISDRLSELAQTFAVGMWSGHQLKGKYLRKCLADFAAFRLHLIKETSRQGGILDGDIAPEGSTALHDTADIGDVNDFLREAGHISLSRKFFSTRHGMLGVGPRMLQQGDLVAFSSAPPFRSSYVLLDRDID